MPYFLLLSGTPVELELPLQKKNWFKETHSHFSQNSEVNFHLKVKTIV